ncbi:hypothetical protein SAMN05421763_105320 [[Luteovulum] sphaeroides subsp. megalophilum]|uniref:hypothetical protein n=1 Tax=Cereibacter sphaeroides TaxID=1063 RepID=UPI000B6CCDFA|nr:hypothetical protein [Cereibacter sphaeroides]SNT16933.1 hypothetical protein SAMN05421763_105320 [[Luteovulum] sphaeroides subsp. megalophilum]
MADPLNDMDPLACRGSRAIAEEAIDTCPDFETALGVLLFAAALTAHAGGLSLEQAAADLLRLQKPAATLAPTMRYGAHAERRP